MQSVGSDLAECCATEAGSGVSRGGLFTPTVSSCSATIAVQSVHTNKLHGILSLSSKIAHDVELCTP